MSITIDTSDLRRLDLKAGTEKRIKGALEKKTLKVGFFDTAKYPNGASVAEVATYNEFGTSKIPPRPFMRHAVDDKKKEWMEFLARNIEAWGDVHLAFGRLGEKTRNDIIRSIDLLREPPNSPATIARKKSSHPLIDTGFLKSNVTYEVGDKGKK